MKKISLLVVLLIIVSSALFAFEQSVNLGAGYHFGYGLAAKNGDERPDRYLRNTHVDFNLGYNAEFDNGLVVYDNVGIGILGKVELKGGDYLADNLWGTNGKWEQIWDKNDGLLLQEDIGAGYAFHFGDVRLVAGGGLHYEWIMTSGSEDGNHVKNADYYALGINLLIQGDYKFNDSFGIFASLKPNFNMYSFWNRVAEKGHEYLNGDCSGFAMGFSGSAIIGATYSF